MKVESTSFKDGELIPKKYTCESDDTSPQVSWSGFPEKAKSFVLLMDDPDAPGRTFTHWVVYDIPPSVNSLKENFPKMRESEGIKQGVNDFGKVGYGGPCPPRGHGYHRYYIKVYALDVETLGLPPEATKSQVEKRMEGHVIAQGYIMGRYRRD
ncbi:MAG: YbhB/YbcL family Raf kinase inhibitor-like protein [Aquificaceae bacterium]